MNFKSRSSKKRDLSDPSNDGKITKIQEKVIFVRHSTMFLLGAYSHPNVVKP